MGCQGGVAGGADCGGGGVICLVRAAGIRDGGKAPLFRSAAGRTGSLTQKPMNRVVKATILVRRYAADTTDLFYGPRCIGRYAPDHSALSVQTKQPRLRDTLP